MKRKFEKKGWMILKLDLEKAYDWIHWPFLRQVIQAEGFDEKFTNLIMWSVQYSSFLFYGTVLNWIHSHHVMAFDKEILFHPTYLCCIWRFSVMPWSHVQAKLNGGVFPSLAMVQLSPISFFADDVLLFGEASVRQAHIILDILDSFCSFFG